MLYNLIIYPPVQIIEIAYMLFYKAFKSPSIAILGVSAAVTFLCLPLYIVAEKWQNIERETQKRLFPMVNNIKTVFKGDERFMLLSEFYRQNHYHPIYGLRSSFGILIQIPFFMAAYSYLSHLEVLNGVSFLFIRNLGAPDAFTNISNFSINLLPILMTAINIVSGILYTRYLPLKDKVQLFGMAGIFLLLLYNSPAGLVIYWTMNNILSLVKNIFYKLKNPLKVLYIVVCILVAAFVFYLIFISRGAHRKRVLLAIVLSLIFFIPFYIRIFNYSLRNWLSILVENKNLVTAIYFSGSIALTLLIGLCIPSMVISSSPEEFSFIDSYKAPWVFILNSFFQAAGLFLIWPTVVYFLFRTKVRITMAILFSIFSIYAFINTFAFQGRYGNISNTLLFDSPGVLAVSKFTIMINILIFIILIIIFFFILKKRKSVLINSIMIITVSFLAIFSIYNLFIINRGYKKALAIEESSGGSIHRITPVFSLSKTKNNVIVLMQDSAIGAYLDSIFDEHPHLNKQFEGFTLFPNTVSFAPQTLMGAPPLWGGYEYTPKEMVKNDSRTMLEKHNESLMVLPVLFNKFGFDVTVADQSWANYSWISDLSIYDSTGIKALNTIKMYTNLWFMEHDTGEDNITSKKIMRNTIWFSLLKVVPPFLRSFIYDESLYWSPENLGESIVNFVNSYAVLEYLAQLTTYDSPSPSAIFLTNELIHDSIFLQYPDYTPATRISDRGNRKYSSSRNYHANVAFYLKFGNFLDSLKKNNVYDNTRVIIVADHGSNVDAEIIEQVPLLGSRVERYNPLLLVKDFNSLGPLRKDITFMTNADMPFLATQNIIPNASNPFTGIPFTPELKNTGVIITNSRTSMPYQHPKYKFNIADNQWFKVRDNIFNSSNWSQLEN